MYLMRLVDIANFAFSFGSILPLLPLNHNLLPYSIAFATAISVGNVVICRKHETNIRNVMNDIGENIAHLSDAVEGIRNSINPFNFR
jgi:hypothetical protein